MIISACNKVKTAHSNKPSVFIVGAPRCGTTALTKYLGGHSRVFVPRGTITKHGKLEPHFFCPIGITSTIEQYEALYSEMGDNHVGVDSSVYYLYYAKEAAPRIVDYQPNARIIVMVRDPLSVIESLFSEQTFRGKETCRSINERMRSILRGTYVPQDAQTDYCGVVDFARQIETFNEHLSKERVHVVLFDEFANETRKQYEMVLDHIGVSRELPEKMPVVNKRKTVRSKKLQRMVRSPPRIAKRFARLFPRDIMLGLRNRVMDLNMGGRPETIDKETEMLLRKRLRTDIEKLEELVGKDLTRWK